MPTTNFSLIRDVIPHAAQSTNLHQLMKLAGEEFRLTHEEWVDVIAHLVMPHQSSRKQEQFLFLSFHFFRSQLINTIEY